MGGWWWQRRSRGEHNADSVNSTELATNRKPQRSAPSEHPGSIRVHADLVCIAHHSVREVIQLRNGLVQKVFVELPTFLVLEAGILPKQQRRLVVVCVASPTSEDVSTARAPLAVGRILSTTAPPPPPTPPPPPPHSNRSVSDRSVNNDPVRDNNIDGLRQQNNSKSTCVNCFSLRHFSSPPTVLLRSSSKKSQQLLTYNLVRRRQPWNCTSCAWIDDRNGFQVYPLGWALPVSRSRSMRCA